MSPLIPDRHSPQFSRRRFAGASAAALGAAALPVIGSAPVAAQPVDPFAYMVAMTETETVGQRAGQPVDEVGPVEADGVMWTAMIQVPVKRGQWFHYTCEFDSAWCVMMAYGVDATLDAQVDAVGIDNRVVPYWEETQQGILIYGGDIGEHFSGELDSNMMSRAKGSAIRKAFESHGFVAEPVSDRAGIEVSLNAGYPVWFKSTVDFLDWLPATWYSPEGYQYQVVFSNDHALVVIAYSDTEVVIRDPLGPTSTNTQRPYQYRVTWERFLQVFASQGNDGLAVAPEGAPALTASGGPALATATTEPQVESTPQPTPTQTPAAAQVYAPGERVRVGADPLNVRGEASIESVIVVELAPGSLLEITGASVEAEGYTWYPIEVVYSGRTGYVAQDFLVPVDD